MRIARKTALVLGLATLLLLLPGIRAGAVTAARSVKFPCKTVGTASLDPIVNPDGSPSAHEHVFFGNRGVPLGVRDYEAAIEEGTSCTFAGDTASYWRPTLFDANGTPVAAKNVVYYDRMTSQRIVAFPPDFGEIFGANRGLFSPKQRSYYGWNCDNREPLSRSFASVDCRSYSSSSNVLTFRAFSPFCWDGVVPASRDYGSHVFYPPNYPTSATCPAGSIVLPRLRVNVNFATKYLPNGRLSSDAPGEHGESAHTDFWNTWQQGALEGLVETLNG
ncbi:MAG TPA: DUF1996 domain-containing protein [Actinomycetota bacterium]|nr:DUF1996 domain-containing protein [Actinomycetota bacterium]